MWFFLSLLFALWTSIYMLLVKKLTRSLDAILFMFFSNIALIIAMFILLQFLGGFPKVSRQFYEFMILSSIFDVIAFFASTTAIKISPVSLISPISSFNPVFTTIIAAFTLGELPRITGLLGILLIVIGAYLLNISEIKSGFLSPLKSLITNKGVRLFFLANFLWAITPIFQKKAILLTSPQSPLFPSFIGSLMIALFVLPMTVSKMNKNYLFDINKNVGLFIILGVLGAFSYLAAFTAFSLTNVAYVTAIFKLSTLFTILIGWLFLKETHIKERFVGAIVMIIGTILIAA